MKILYLCADPGIPLYGRKGCSTHVRETCYVLQRMGHEVKVLCSNVEGDDRGEQRLDLVDVPPYQSKKLGFDLRRYLLDLRIWKRLQSLVEQWKPDVIYERYSLYSFSGECAEKKYGLPRLMEVNAFLTKEQRDRINVLPLARWAERHIIKRAPRVIVVSEPLAREVEALGTPKHRIIKMPMAVDLERFHPRGNGSELRRELGLEDVFVIGYVGTLSGWHGLRLLYPMARRLKELGAPPFVFLIVGGEGSKLEQSRARAAEEGMADTMRFIGSVPHESVPAYLRVMDAGIIPDTTYWSSPSKLFEYMASGVAVLAPRYPAILEAITHAGEGMIFEPNEPEQMADAALALLRDREQCRRIGAQARVRAEQERSWLRNGQSIVKLYREMGARVE